MEVVHERRRNGRGPISDERKGVIVFTWLLAIVISVSSPIHHQRQLATVGTTNEAAKAQQLRHAIQYHRQRTWSYQDRAGVSRSPTRHRERSTSSVSFLNWINHLWQHRLARARKLAVRRPSDLGAWMCIHSHEGSWTDSGAPYWGGLQMDLTFQQEYGGEFLRRYGTADHWPVSIQILVARRARDGYKRWGPRGYGPWPNTARMCGLLG